MTNSTPNLPHRFLFPDKVILRTSPEAGSDGMWGNLNSSVWRSLSDQNGSVSLPSIDWIEQNLRQEGDESSPHLSRFEGHLSLWSSILELLNYSFGWRSPAYGVAKWVETGCPTDDIRFSVIAHLLGDDVEGRAINLAAFLFLQHGWELTRYGHGMTSDQNSRGIELDPTKVPAWVKNEFKQRGCGDDADAPEIESPQYLPCVSGGWDSLHLVGHSWSPISRTATRQGAPLRGLAGGERDSSSFFYADPIKGTATLVTDTYRDWYDDLNDFGNQLDPLKSGRSWRVDVFCKPIGWLGTFRKSRETGLWFSGPHSLHVWGELR